MNHVTKLFKIEIIHILVVPTTHLVFDQHFSRASSSAFLAYIKAGCVLVHKVYRIEKFWNMLITLPYTNHIAGKYLNLHTTLLPIPRPLFFSMHNIYNLIAGQY